MNAERLHYLEQLRRQRGVTLKQLEELNEIYAANYHACVDLAETKETYLSELSLGELQRLRKAISDLQFAEEHLNDTNPCVLAFIYEFVFSPLDLPEWGLAHLVQCREFLEAARYHALKDCNRPFDFFICPSDFKFFAYFDSSFLLHAYDRYMHCTTKYTTRQAISLVKLSLREYFDDIQQQLHSVLGVYFPPEEAASCYKEQLQKNYLEFCRMQIARAALLPVLTAFSHKLREYEYDPTSVFSLLKKVYVDKTSALLEAADIFKDGEIALSLKDIVLSDQERDVLGSEEDVIAFLLETMKSPRYAALFMEKANLVYRAALPLGLRDAIAPEVTKMCGALISSKENQTLEFFEFCERNFGQGIAGFQQLRHQMIVKEAHQLMQDQVDELVSGTPTRCLESQFYYAEISGVCRYMWETEGAALLDSLKYMKPEYLRRIVAGVCYRYGSIANLKTWQAGYEFANEQSE